MRIEIKSLQHQNFWAAISKSSKNDPLYTDSLFERKLYDQNAVKRYKARLVICCNEETNSNENNFLTGSRPYLGKTAY